MPATLQSPRTPPAAEAKRPAPRRQLTLEELVRRAARSLESSPARRIIGTFRPVINGRALTRIEKGLMALMAGGLGLAIWLHAQPDPVSAHAAHYRQLAGTTQLEAGAPRTFAESALQALGRDWRAATFFECTHPAFWAGAGHPNARVARVEEGLAKLAAHGPVVSVLSFPAATAVETEVVAGVGRLAARVAGQLEFADGAVLRFEAHLVEDAATKRWGVVALTVPGYLP